MVKRFRSCFICGVEIDSEKKLVTLEDSGKNSFYIFTDKCSPEALASFQMWFENFYVKGIPQVLTILDYSIAENEDGENVYTVNKMIAGSSSLVKETLDGKQA